MPKLSADKMNLRKAKIEKAALACFLKHGYNGVSVRDIADHAGVSLGNLYTYYPDKLTLFQSVVKAQTQYFLSKDNPIELYIKDCDFPNDLDKLAEAVEAAVEKYRAFFKLTYIDVVEFDGAHVGSSFSNVYAKFSGKLSEHYKKNGKLGSKKQIDPNFAFVGVYLQFYYFYALKKLFRAKNVYGEISDREVVKQISELFLSGLR